MTAIDDVVYDIPLEPGHRPGIVQTAAQLEAGVAAYSANLDRPRIQRAAARALGQVDAAAAEMQQLATDVLHQVASLAIVATTPGEPPTVQQTSLVTQAIATLQSRVQQFGGLARSTVRVRQSAVDIGIDPDHPYTGT